MFPIVNETSCKLYSHAKINQTQVDSISKYISKSWTWIQTYFIQVELIFKKFKKSKKDGDERDKCLCNTRKRKLFKNYVKFCTRNLNWKMALNDMRISLSTGLFKILRFLYKIVQNSANKRAYLFFFLENVGLESLDFILRICFANIVF